MNWDVLPGLFAIALAAGAFIALRRADRKIVARCQCGKREMPLRAWKERGELREPYLGWAHNRVKCRRIPEEGNTYG